MTAINIRDQLKKNCLELYLTKSSTGYFTTPEVYTPLYRVLYESLLAGEQPPYINDSEFENSEIDIKECNNTFDRYLVALFPSRYEASNPLKVKSDDLKEQKLLEYLQQKYSKSSTDIDSYNIARKINEIIELADTDRADFFRKNSRSSIYKILTLSYKLSLINKKWMSLIRYIDPADPKNASMDNIVNFNLLDIKEAKLNSAVAKMFYYEIDAGKPDGDDTYSRRIVELPIHVSYLSRLVKRHLIILAQKNSTLSQVERLSDILISDFSNFANTHYREPPVYKDSDLEFMDAIQYNMLLNIESNGIIARKNFEESISDYNIELKNESCWIDKVSTYDQALIELGKELDIDPEKINQEYVDVSATLLKILSICEPGIDTRSKLSRNICLIAIVYMKFNKSNISSKIFGSNRNKFSAYNEIKRAHEWLSEHDPEISDKYNISLVRPTCLYFFQYMYDKIIWQLDSISMNRNFISYNQLSKLHHKTVHSMLAQLRYKNHVQCLDAINAFYKSKAEEPKSLTAEFLDSIGSSQSFLDMVQRSDIRWSPLKS